MAKKKILLILQSVLCVLTALALIVADLSIYFEGLSLKEVDPMANIYTVEAVAGRAVFVLPFFLAAVAVTLISAVMGVKDEKADKPVLKVDIKKNTEEGRPSPAVLKTARVILLVLGIAFIIIGIFNGSMMDVFIKASKICTECIGLG